jgi:hypothetical protein
LYLTSRYKDERRMLAMDKVHGIRYRYFAEGEKISHIARTLGLDWRTVQKYVDMDDLNEPSPKLERRLCPKLDPHKTVIDQWLTEDKQAPRKQRHTAQRLFVSAF